VGDTRPPTDASLPPRLSPEEHGRSACTRVLMLQTEEQPEREWVKVSDRARTKGNTKALNKAHSRDLINYCSALVEEHEEDVRTSCLQPALSRTEECTSVEVFRAKRWPSTRCKCVPYPRDSTPKPVVQSTPSSRARLPLAPSPFSHPSSQSRRATRAPTPSRVACAAA